MPLDELNRAAGLLTRVDRKYLIDLDLLQVMLEAHEHRLAVLEIDGLRSFAYSSHYFDTPDLSLHRAAATGRRRRVKVRTRVYEDIGTAALEVKAKDGRGHTVKHRQSHLIDQVGELGIPGAAFVDGLTSPGFAGSLAPILTTRYRRSTLLDPTEGTRATFDISLECSHVDGRSVRYDHVTLETKSDLRPSVIDRWIWRRGVRPVRYSKYCTTLAMLEPDLPSNRWHRTISRHLSEGVAIHHRVAPEQADDADG